MPAWKHTRHWDAGTYAQYRRYIRDNAPRWRANYGADCADLSAALLIHFAAENGLPLTLKGMDHVRYISKATRQTPEATLSTKTWSTKEEYLAAVMPRLGTEALWHRNTVSNPSCPEPGDLLMAFSASMHHTALVYQVYPPNTSHPRATERGIPDFPGDEAAIAQVTQTLYFRGRRADGSVRFDYLNFRSRRKNVAELILFASADEMRADGLQFRKWKDGVLDNWIDWDGTGDPPR